MELSIRSLFSSLISEKEKRILIVGLDQAGKESIMAKLDLGEITCVNPTAGFTVKNVEFNNLTLTSWDLGGENKIRLLWRHYYQGVDAVIFVVDKNDRDRIYEARDALHIVIAEDELRDALLLVMANKMDLPNAMSAADITDKLGLHSLRQRRWYIQDVCALDGRGIYESVEWLCNSSSKGS